MQNGPWPSVVSADPALLSAWASRSQPYGQSLQNYLGCAWVLRVALLLITLVTLSARPLSADEAATTVGSAIQRLESNDFPVRVRATETLIEAGQEAIEPVLKAAETGQLETISRSTYVLRQLALDNKEPDTADAAYQALRQLAEHRLPPVARRAQDELQTVHTVRKRYAQTELARLGAVFADFPVVVPLQNTAVFPSVQITDQWQGSPEQLELLSWLTQSIDEESERPWMVIMEGIQINNAAVRIASQLDNVAVLKIKRGNIDDTAIKYLQESSSLTIIELLYTPVTDEAFQHLANLPNVSRYRLIGNQMTLEASAEFEQQVVAAEVDFRLGGFLGVGCNDNPCEINRVQDQSAADRAGFRVGDVIVRYNDSDVNSMTELTKLIAQHKSSEEVVVEIQRGSERIKRKVKLGEWD